MTAPRAGALPIWPLALLAGLLPLAGTLVAWAISAHAGLVPACNPFVEGCISVSRAARQPPALPWFRAIALPGAVLQGLVWVLLARGLAAGPEPSGSRAPAWLAVLGPVGAAALVLYVSFLGTEGALFRALRHVGTVAYFGFTCIAFLLLARALDGPAAPAGAVRGGNSGGNSGGGSGGGAPEGRWLRRLAITLVLLGIGNAMVAALFGPDVKARVENVTEWWGALLIVIGFGLLARLWRRTGAAWWVGAPG